MTEFVASKMQGFGSSAGDSRPCAAGRGTRASHGWQFFASLELPALLSKPIVIV